MPRVFITGVGFVTSIGNDKAAVTQNLRELRHGFELYPPFQKPDIPCKVVGTIKEFNIDSADPEDWVFPSRYKIKRELLRSMAPNGLYAHCAMLQAIEDAKLSDVDISNPETGLYAASGGSPFLTHWHHERLLKVGVMRLLVLGIVAAIAGHRRNRRRDVDRPGWVPWQLIEILSFFLAFGAAVLALKL